MVQLEMYLKEPINFLRTVTLKNEHFVDHCLRRGVTLEYQDILPPELNPYYRHLNGEWILMDDTTNVNGKEVPNIELYTTFDEKIVIVSVDADNEEIEFTKENLASSKYAKTAALYRIPGQYYTKLCEKYPRQVDLIKSIVYPIVNKEPDKYSSPLDYAINGASNLEILSCDLEILQENERYSIQEALERMLRMIKDRWWVPEFCYEDMYPMAHQAILWNLLYLTIYAQRINNIKTSKAHNFHIWNYLNSKGIGDYKSILTLDQSLFLYRNIDYILRHKGTDRNLSILIGSLLRPLNIDLYNKSIAQTTEEGKEEKSEEPLTRGFVLSAEAAPKTVEADSGVSSFANNCKPSLTVHTNYAGDSNLVAQATALVTNTTFGGYGVSNNVVQDILTSYMPDKAKTIPQELTASTQSETTELYNREQKSLLEYEDDNLFTASTITQEYKFRVTPHTFLTTKVHEFKRSLGSILLSLLYCKYVEEALLYWSTIRYEKLDKLNYSVLLTPPYTQEEVVLSAKQAIAVLMYCACKEKGITLTAPPDHVTLTVAYLDEFKDIPSTIEMYGGTLSTLPYLNVKTDRPDSFVDMHAYPGVVDDADLAARYIDDQAMSYVRHWLEVRKWTSSIRNAIMESVYATRCTNGVYELDLLNGATYKEFFATHPPIGRSIQLYEETHNNQTLFGELFDAIFEKLYPAKNELVLESDIALKIKYKKLKELFTGLCSYNITFVDDIDNLDYTSLYITDISFDYSKNIFEDNFILIWEDHLIATSDEVIKPAATFGPIDIVVHDPDEGNIQETLEVHDFITTRLIHEFYDYYLYTQLTDHDDQYELEHEGV